MTKPTPVQTGEIRLTRKGGWLGETFIDEANLGLALDGDTVEVKEGQVVKIIKRKRTEFVGTLEKSVNGFILIPDTARTFVKFEIPSKNVSQAKAGDKVLVELTKWTKPELNPEAKVIKIFGQEGENETEMQAITMSHGFVPEFPDEVETEAKKIKQNFSQDLEAEAKVRRDFRQIPTFTIDPVDAKDFDDALSFRKIGQNEFEVGVHIADVSHYVRPGTALDDEAKKRATSIYLVDRTIPMLPEVLSNDVCSLVPNQDRLTFSAVFTLNQAGEILTEWYGRTIIHSIRRFSYEEAQEVLDKKRDEYKEELTILNKLAYKLREQKIEAGAISFEDEEVKFVLDANGRPLKVIKKIRTDSHLLIEDFMLLANKKVAEFASKYNEHRPHTFVYRIHDWPNMDKMTSLVSFLKPLGYDLKIKDSQISSQDLNRLLAAAEEKSESHIINRAAIRAMSKAIYSTENIGHWGLAFPYYTHFTSPIRRYPDLMVHRLLDIFLNKKKPTKAMLDEVAVEVVRSSEREAEAAEAERESVKLKQVEYMASRLGQEYWGIISGVTEFGFFVEENETKSEGLVAVRDLNDDYYQFDEKTLSLVGQKKKKRFRLGDRVKIKIKAADPKRRRLDYELKG